MILESDNISLFYGANEVLRSVSFRVDERDRLGIAGHNGCGKTTLLNILTGELLPSGGSFSLKNGATLGYLKQTAGLCSDNTVYAEMKSVGRADELLARMKRLEREMGGDPSLLEEYERVSSRYEAMDGYNLDYNIKKILNGMSFPESEYDKKVSVLSGGEKTRLALAKLLMSSPDLLVLDEPTNHLDITTLEWLEKFLLDYSGAIVLVSHDRQFLDDICNKTLEIRGGVARMFKGNFSTYLALREADDAREKEVYERTSREADKLRDYARRNMARASTSNMAKSRLKMLDRLDLSAPESAAHVDVHFSIKPLIEPYKEVLTLTGLELAVGTRILVRDLDLELLRGERLAIIGPNGTGKTTLLRCIAGKHPPKTGRLRLGGGVKMSVLEQNLYDLRAENPVEYIWGLYPAMSQLEIRSLLASVGFRGDDAFTACSGLSGGELARLGLARISLEHPNLLVLDEPTNHLDIYSKDLLYDALREYEGTLVVVTHDRFLMQTLDCRILQLADDGSHAVFESYALCRAAANDESVPAETKPEKTVSGGKPDGALEQTKSVVANAKEERRKRARDRERRAFVEQRIDELEGEVYDLESQLSLPEIATDCDKLAKVCELLDKNKSELSELSDEWLECFCD
ncbi:MAG: ABC-F family ATP-binding cassette domain-containing protein [Oscillospiraceae bacterium]